MSPRAGRGRHPHPTPTKEGHPVTHEPTARQDRRYGAPDAPATPWRDVTALLGRAELYWITTVRADGRPHVTPLIGVWHDDALHFTTGDEEQKYRNLEHSPKVALTTGNNTWQQGLDVVVEGEAEPVRETARAAGRRGRARGQVRQRLALRRRRRRVRARRRRGRGAGVPGPRDEGHGVRQGPARADRVPLRLSARPARLRRSRARPPSARARSAGARRSSRASATGGSARCAATGRAPRRSRCRSCRGTRAAGCRARAR